MSELKCALKFNNCECWEPCAVCGEFDVVRIGPALFVHDGWQPVCECCAQSIDPELLELLRLSRALTNYRENVAELRGLWLRY